MGGGDGGRQARGEGEGAGFPWRLDGEVVHRGLNDQRDRRGGGDERGEDHLDAVNQGVEGTGAGGERRPGLLRRLLGSGWPGVERGQGEGGEESEVGLIIAGGRRELLPLGRGGGGGDHGLRQELGRRWGGGGRGRPGAQLLEVGLPAGGGGAAGGIALNLRELVVGLVGARGVGAAVVAALVQGGNPRVLGDPPGVLARLLPRDGRELEALLPGEPLLAAVALDVVAAEVLEHVVVAREGFRAAVVGTGEGLLPGVLADVAAVVLQALEGPVAVGAGELEPVCQGLGAALGRVGGGATVLLGAVAVEVKLVFVGD